jgi:hypothetical protein
MSGSPLGHSGRACSPLPHPSLQRSLLPPDGPSDAPPFLLCQSVHLLHRGC